MLLDRRIASPGKASHHPCARHFMWPSGSREDVGNTGLQAAAFRVGVPVFLDVVREEQPARTGRGSRSLSEGSPGTEGPQGGGWQLTA